MKWTRAAVAAAVAATLPFAPAAPAAAQAADEPAHDYTVLPGDTVIGLSRRLLADPRRWAEVARHNRLPDANRIRPGQVLLVPLRLLDSVAVPAGVLSVTGEVRGAAPGQPLAEGSEVATGADGHVTLRLVDGSVLRLRPESRFELRESRRLPRIGVQRTAPLLHRGRVEVEAEPARSGKPGFRIGTPQGVLAVRGTTFRVAAEDAATRGEVTAGSVAFNGRLVTAGHGATIDAAGRVAPPAPLLPQPDLSALPPLQERILMRFVLPPLPGAAAYRAQIARDGAFDVVVADLLSATPELRFAELPDGDYMLRVRARDAQGFEGRDADRRFTLKARPEPPLPTTPAPGAELVGRVDFAWTTNPAAQSYRLQIAGDAQFRNLTREMDAIRDAAAGVEGLPPGRYHWRLASVRGEGPGADRGPWGDARDFVLRPPPPAPPKADPPRVGDHAVTFGWQAVPGQTTEFQVARDAAFAAPLLAQRLTTNGIEWRFPGPGRFHVRLRAIDADGYTGPWSTPQHFDVPNCVRDGSAGCVRSGEGPLRLAD